MKHRIIPLLTFDETGLVKANAFGARQYVGDLLNAAKVFEEFNADELAVISIHKECVFSEGIQKNLRVLSKWFKGPIAYGGGINSFDDAKKVFEAGCEKVIISNGFLNAEAYVEEISNIYDSQAVIKKIDVISTSVGWKVFDSRNSTVTSIGLNDYVKNWGSQYCGELMLTVVSSEKKLSEVKYDLAQNVRAITHKPVIFSSGVRETHEIEKLSTLGIDATAVGAGAVFDRSSDSVLLNDYWSENDENL